MVSKGSPGPYKAPDGLIRPLPWLADMAQERREMGVPGREDRGDKYIV